ncbi:MAG: hypothetical protein U0354_19345 [Candidatus Sericytochromatia bacterium]
MEVVILFIKILSVISVWVLSSMIPAFYIAKNINIKNLGSISLIVSITIIFILSYINDAFGIIAFMYLYPFNTILFKTLSFKGNISKIESIISMFFILKKPLSTFIENSIKRNI